MHYLLHQKQALQKTGRLKEYRSNKETHGNQDTYSTMYLTTNNVGCLTFARMNTNLNHNSTLLKFEFGTIIILLTGT